MAGTLQMQTEMALRFRPIDLWQRFWSRVEARLWPDDNPSRRADLEARVAALTRLMALRHPRPHGR